MFNLAPSRGHKPEIMKLMKSYAVSIYPMKDGKWNKDEGAIRVDVLAGHKAQAITKAVERMATAGDGEHEHARFILSPDLQYITLEHGEEIRTATIVVAENKELLMSNLFIEEA